MRGTGIGQGIAIGRAVRMAEPLPEPIDRRSHLSPEREEERARAALSVVAVELRARGKRAGGAASEVLEAQAMMAEDPSLIDDMKAQLARGKTAERAVYEAFTGYRDSLLEVGGYLAERAADVDDVSRRVVANLLKLPPPRVPDLGSPFVLVARYLAPADTAVLDFSRVLAIVTIEGGPTSHTAILAREKSVTTVVGVAEAASIGEGDLVIVDAAGGEVIVSPSPAEIEQAKKRMPIRGAGAAMPIAPGILADGIPVPLLANLGSLEGVAEAHVLGAEGIGLFRTEFLFLDAQKAPSVLEQQLQYSRLFGKFLEKKVVVRVLDAGSDKPLSFLNDSREDNPALGLRGIRALIASEEILREQLTALSAAASTSSADVWVMAPMVATVAEARYFVTLAHELGLKTAGVMIEIPSAALMAEAILDEVDFVSIGTNDLTQYTLAADRLLSSVADLQNPWHPAVLRLITEAGRAGKVRGKPVGICGEAAADALLAVVFVGLGVTSLSMVPGAFSEVRIMLSRFTLEQAEAVARAALAATEATQARAAAANIAETFGIQIDQ